MKSGRPDEPNGSDPQDATRPDGPGGAPSASAPARPGSQAGVDPTWPRRPAGTPSPDPTWPSGDTGPQNQTWPPAPDSLDGQPAVAPAGAFAGRYSIERELGRGGMGRVYVAHDPRLQRKVALKVLAPSATDEEAMRRFEQEARAAGALHHPNVLTVLDAGQHEGQPFIVSELLEGRTLRTRLDERRLKLREALELALQMARGLSAAHAKGIVHRDLKPDNLFIDDEGWLKILDFGIAKLLPVGDAQADQPQTETGRIIGTVGYMSPEQVRGQAVDHRADLFSFGAVLYEMLSGKRAFRGATALETTYAIVTKEPPPLPADVPQPVRLLVERCLKKDQAARPETARAIAAELEGLLAATPTQPTLHAVGKVRRRKQVLVVTAALVALAVLIALSLPRGPEKSARGAVAVMPFTVRGSPQFAYLGEGMVDLLNTNLSGGVLRLIDPHAIVRQLGADAGAVEAQRAVQVAGKLGADRVIIGSILEVEKRLRVQASLYDVASPEHPLLEAKAEGDAGELFHLVDELTAQLRRKLVPSGSEPEGPGGRLARLGQRMTRSPDALKAYLEGEATLRRGSWRYALEAFQRAVALDPEFALAQYRLAVAASIREPGLADDSLRRAIQLADKLSPRDRALLDAYAALMQGRAGDGEKLYRALLATHPDEVEAWFQLGELLFHLGPLELKPATDAAEAFGRTLILDPDHGGALIHIIDVAQLQGQRQLALALVDRYLTISDAEPGTKLPMQWTRAWAQGDLSARAWILEELKRPATPKADLYRTMIRSFWQGDDLADARALASLYLDRPQPDFKADGYSFLALLDLAQGRPKSARARLAKASELEPDGRHRFDALWMDTLDHLPVDRAALAASLEAAKAFQDPRQKPYVQQNLVGLLAARAGDQVAAEAAVNALLAAGKTTAFAGDLALALRARLYKAQGHPKEALDALEKQRLVVPYQEATANVRLAEPLLRAELLSSAGRREEALRLCGLASFYSRQEVVYLAPSALCAAHVHEALGQKVQAAAALRRFIELWKDAEPELQPEVAKARKRLAAVEKK